MKFFLITSVLAVLFGTFSHAAQTTESKPNVILIMADDLGYRDLSSYGHPSIETPHLDELAQGGMKLTNFHAGASVCTPSRMALLTGAYPVRLGWTQGVAGYLMGALDGMSGDALTIADIFKAEGYATGISGKWHIGRMPESRPHRQGFDSAHYIPMSNNQIDEIWNQDEIVVKPAKNPLHTENFSNEAKRFIRENRDKPFFLYLAHTAPHFPVEPHPEWKGKSEFGDYGDVVEELDARTGELLALLEELDLTEKTIVIFISDNGPQGGEKASSLPLRGMKWSPLEGGTRVPGIISWPGTIPAGQTSDALISAIDLLPTLSRAAGIDWKNHSKGKPPIDGLDVWDTLIGKEATHARTELLHWHGKHAKPQAFTSGAWKIFFDGRDTMLDPGTSEPKAAEPPKPFLVNLKNDIDESDDLSGEFPEKTQELYERGMGLIQELEASEKLEIVTQE